MNQFAPSPWAPEYTVRANSNFFRKFAEIFEAIFAALGAPPVLLTPAANGKNLQPEKFKFFVWTPLGSRVKIYINFCLQVHFKVPAA
jgi:hypothetical protein